MPVRTIITASRSETQSRSAYRPRTNLTNITNDSRIRRSTTHANSSKRSSANNTKENIQTIIDQKKYLQKLSILDIHRQTRPIKKHKPLDLSTFLIEQSPMLHSKQNVHNLPTTKDIEIQCDAITPRPITPYKINGKST